MASTKPAQIIAIKGNYSITDSYQNVSAHSYLNDKLSVNIGGRFFQATIEEQSAYEGSNKYTLVVNCVPPIMLFKTGLN